MYTEKQKLLNRTWKRLFVYRMWNPSTAFPTQKQFITPYSISKCVVGYKVKVRAYHKAMGAQRKAFIHLQK